MGKGLRFGLLSRGVLCNLGPLRSDGFLWVGAGVRETRGSHATLSGRGFVKVWVVVSLPYLSDANGSLGTQSSKMLLGANYIPKTARGFPY